MERYTPCAVGTALEILIKIISDVISADAGAMRIGGETLDASQIKPRTVHDLGVRVVHQELGIFPDVSID
jgi:ribose transport system ATP-binding protein